MNQPGEAGGTEIADLAMNTLLNIGLPPPGSTPPDGQPPAPPAPPQPPQPAPPAPPATPPGQPVPLPADIKSKLGNRFSAQDSEPIFKPVAEPPPPQDPPPGDEPPAGTTPQAHAFAQLRSENAKYKREVIPAMENAKRLAEEARAAAEAKVAAILAEKTAVEQEKTSLLEQLGRVSLTESPQFKEKYGTKELTVTQKLTGALQKFAGMTPEQAAEFASQVRQSTGDAEGLTRATAELHPAVAGAAMIAAQEYAAIEEEMKHEVSNWRQTSAAAGVQQSREAVVQSAEERKQLADEAIAFAKRQGNPVFASTDPEEAAEVADVMDAFHGFVQSATEAELVKAASEGFTAPFLYQRIAQREQEITELRQQLQGFRQAVGIPVGIPQPHQPQAPKPVLPTLSGNETVEEIANRFAADTVNGFGQRPL